MRKNKTKETLIVFVKNAVLGRVKTRIATDSSDQKALEIYLELLKILQGSLENLDIDKSVFYSQIIDSNDQWSKNRYNQYVQKGNDIGDRMMLAFSKMFEFYSRIVLIGSDCPSITEEIIDDAFILLERNDVVLGPALDGGYYLIGMNDFYPALFDNINWSTDKVFQQTLKRVLDLKLELATVTPLSDIDTIKDWERYLNAQGSTIN